MESSESARERERERDRSRFHGAEVRLLSSKPKILEDRQSCFKSLTFSKSNLQQDETSDKSNLHSVKLLFSKDIF